MKLIICLFSIITFYGCSEINNPITPSEDDLLKSKLIGRWSEYGNYIIHFYNDNTFIDSLYDLTHPDSLQFIVKGKYNIKDSIWIPYELKCLFADTINVSPNVIGDRLMFYPQKVYILNNKLDFNLVEILTQSIGNKNDLVGTWESEVWIIGIEKRINWEVIQGSIQNSYTFYPDSLAYNLSITSSINSSFINSKDSGSYSYNPPILELNSFYFNVRFYTMEVTFKNNKMYWLYIWEYLSKKYNQPFIRSVF